MTLAEEFAARSAPDYRGHADMRPHMATLAALAAQCIHCTEFGVRTGNSTIALLHGLSASGGHLASYDLNPPVLALPELPAGTTWTPYQADTARLSDLPATDLLLVDTLHTGPQVAAELRHAHRVRRFIAFHDVVKNGFAGEADAAGILPAIFDFLVSAPAWQVAHFEHSPWGLLVLARH